MTHWSNDEDMRNDLQEISAFYSAVVSEPSPEPSEIKKKLCGMRSMYEMDTQDDEPPLEQYTVLPVRGHPLHQGLALHRGHPLHRGGIRNPGGRPTVTNHQHLQTSANIREVSGFGYSNDLIEHAFKASNSEDEKDPEKMKNLIFGASSPRKQNGKNHKKSDNESDSSASTNSENVFYSSRSNSSGDLDIYNKHEFPDLK